MTDVLDAPEAPFRVTAPIEHITKLDDGTLLVHTVVTDESPDSQGEIVDYDAAKAAAPAMMKWATLGEMHDGDRMDAGTVLRLYFDDDRRRIEADLHVVDPTAVRKVLTRVYKAVSIGGVKLSTTPVDVAGRAFRKITRLVWDELSLVNRGANPNALIAKQFLIAKRDLSKDVDGPPEGGVDREDIPAEDFAGPDRSFPIVTPSSVSDAARLAGHAADPSAVRARIIEIARRKGPEFMAQLPKSWLAGKVGKQHMTELDAGTTSPLQADGPGADDAAPRTAQQEAIDATRAAMAAEPVAKAAKARKAAKAKKHAVVLVEPTAHDEPDGDEGDEPVAKAAKPGPTREERLAKRVKALRKQNRKLAKARRRLQKRSGLAGLTRTLAKAGARNSGKDLERIGKIHDLTVGLGFDKCMTKSAAPSADAAQTVADQAPALAKSAGTADAMREALAGLVPADKLDAMMQRIAAIDERSQAQGEQLAKIARQPSGGGPATPFAPVFRDFAASEDKGSLLAKAAEAIDDPRLRGEVSEAAALEQIRAARQG